MMAVVSISLFFIYIFCLWSLYQGVTRAQKLVCLLRKTILINSQVSEHYFMDFLEKGECFGLTHSLGCVYPTLYIIRLLGRVYHFTFLICYMVRIIAGSRRIKIFLMISILKLV